MPLADLPIAVTGNFDVINYANLALVAADPWPGAADAIVGMPLGQGVRDDMFGTFAVLGAIAAALGEQPIAIVGLAETAVTVVIGMALLDLLRGVLGLPRTAAAVLAAFVLVNPIFSFIRFDFYFSHLSHWAIALGLILTTLAAHAVGRMSFRPLFLRSLPYYLLELFVYPPALLPLLAVHLLLLATLVVWTNPAMRRGGIGSVVRSLLWLPGLAAAELAAIAVIAPDRAAIAVRQLRGLSAAEIGVWPISSLKLLGFPGGPAPWSSAPLVDVAAALAMTAAVVAVLAALWRRRLDGAPAAALLVVFLGAYALYGGALLVRGVSYQTFKLATFFVPLLTAALPAALLGLAAGPGRRLLRAGIIAACAVVVVVDLVAGLRRHFMVLPRDLEPLAAIDALSGIDTVLVQGLSFAETMLVRQYVTRHRLQFGQASYYAWRPIAPAEVSPARPVLFAPGTCFAGAPGVVMLGRFALARALPPVAPAPPAAMAPVAGPAAARDDPCRWLRRGADR